MKNIYILLISCLLCFNNSYSQYHYLPYIGTGKNPGGLNTNFETTTLSGWVSILNGALTSGTYSAAQTIPFPFVFSGDTVKKYKVSNSGILTFDIATAISPGTTNTSLPSASVPDSAICVWGISGTGANDKIFTKTFGASPNRQHWIFFNSYTGGSFSCYWSIVLEESTNNIHIVDQRSTGSVSGLTLGVQTNSTTATQVAGSPNVSRLSVDNYKQYDNVYYTFINDTQPDFDMEMQRLFTGSYLNVKHMPYEIVGMVRNLGTTSINNFDINYSINGGSVVTATISSVNITRFSSHKYTHPATWNSSIPGSYVLRTWISNLNGNQDENNLNDTLTSTIIVSDTIPNIINTYITNVPVYNIIGTTSNSLNKPTDLDFHPDLNRNELWVINRATESSGGSTVTFNNAGKSNQTSSYKKDANSWHFMSLPTGIAFSDNGNFGTSPGVFDANHNGGTPFTGPSLWTSNPAIYAQTSGGNGSHLDMVHVTPFGMGITHEKENVFWVFDGYNNDVARYDFGIDHLPGNDDHSDAIVWRYQEVAVTRINDTIPSHLVLDKKSGWLYVVDNGNARILRLNINSGSFGSAPTFISFEALEQYVNMSGTTWQVYINTGLLEPSGIDIIDDRMIVSDYKNGDIIIYDISGSTPTQLGRIYTGAAGIAGVTIGPDGNIWYVNQVTNQAIRITLGGLISVEEETAFKEVSIYPNPTKNTINFTINPNEVKQIIVLNAIGEIAKTVNSSQQELQTIDVSSLNAGVYFVKAESNKGIIVGRFMKID